MFTPEMLRHSPKSKAVKLDCSQKHTDFKGMFSARKRDTHLKSSSETRLWIVVRKGIMNSLPPPVKECQPANGCVLIHKSRTATRSEALVRSS